MGRRRVAARVVEGVVGDIKGPIYRPRGQGERREQWWRPVVAGELEDEL